MDILPQQHGLLVLNKPSGLTSARCASRLKRLGQKKIGHAGTLDPMARGVLLLLLGHATKIFDYLRLDGEKHYSGSFVLGQVTDTWDAEGAVLETAPWGHVTEKMVTRAVGEWAGTTEQLVPPFSAAKHEGRPLHRLARAGKETPVKIKTVEISRAEVTACSLPSVSFRVMCGSGVYIRSLAHSLGMRLGCGAMLTELTREYSHPFGLDVAHTLDSVLDEPERLPEKLIPIAHCLPDWPEIALDSGQEKMARNGMAIPRQTGRLGESPFGGGQKALLTAAGATPVALAEAGEANGMPVWLVLRGLWNN
jgi:tRNA pseudouridine55 synthase